MIVNQHSLPLMFISDLMAFVLGNNIDVDVLVCDVNCRG